ncbi:MAG TPA: SRPBCC domain-containing protein [Verrucomicrobiae bacterium]|nr:SRPBCC domain-containing protein [Verrucomicrobiae bacterium]
MATPELSPNADEIVSEIQIAAPPDRVFQSLVDPSQVVRWWGQKGVYRCTEFESDLRVGGKWRSAGVDGRGGRFEANGEYLQIDPPRLLVQTWIASWTGDFKSTVRWELEPKEQGTLVRIRHGGLASRPDLRQQYSGWPRLLTWLQALIERGETIENRQAGSWT